MEGARLKAERAHDLAMMTAWHTAIFALKGYRGELKGKKLSDYLISEKPKRSTLADAMSFFNHMKAQGVPIKMYRTPAKDRAHG